MIRVITFDLDDTLWDVRPALIRAERAQWDWLERHIGPPVDRHDSARHREIKQQVLAQAPELKHHISTFRQRFIQSYLEYLGIPDGEANTAAVAAFAAFIAERHNVDVFPEAQPVLEALATKFQLGALTNGNADVRQTTIGSHFDFVFRAEEVGASKPAPALFAAAADAAGVKPKAMVHVGDHAEHDVAGALAFGARAIWLNTSGESHPAADATVKCLSELPEVIGQLTH